MIHPDALLITLLLLLDKLPTARPGQPQPRGRPVQYREALFLKALVVMTVRHLYNVGELLAVLEQPALHPIKALLTDEKGRFPSRSTWQRRLKQLPEKLPTRIGLIGRLLVERIRPWAVCGRAVALDSTVPHATRQMEKLFWWGMGTFHKPPYRVELQVQAAGFKDRQRANLRASVAHPDGYALTAIPVVATLLQYLDSSVPKPGLWMMGHFAEPIRLMKDMKKLGVRFSTSIQYG